MTPLASRREFLGTTVGSAVALASGPLLAQADALPSQQQIEIMGMNRGMQVAAALEQQPGVVIKYVCDIDPKRADEAKDIWNVAADEPQAITEFSEIWTIGKSDILCEAHQSLARPRDDPDLRRRQARLCRKTMQPQPPEGEQ